MGSRSSINALWLKIIAAIIAIGLHAIVLAMALSKPVADITAGDTAELSIQFVDLDMFAEPAEIPEPERIEEQSIEPDYDPFPVPEPEPEPETEPEVIPEPEPEPEPEPVVIPEPEPILDEPDPDDMLELLKPKEKIEPEPKIEPKPEPKIEPKPEPKPKPKPKPKPEPKPKPKPKPAPKPKASVSKATDKPAATQQAVSNAPVDPDRPRSIGKADYLGRKPDPVYPRMSQRLGEQGRVVLRVLVSPDGLVSQVQVKSSSGFERLDKAAIEAVKRAKFRPYTENGIAYKALVDIPFDFII